MTGEQYLALSSMAYSDGLSGRSPVTGDLWRIGELIEANKIKDYYKDGSVALELRPLSSLSDWIIVNAHTSPSGMSAIAVQNPETKEIVFAYRGTDLDKGPIATMKDFVTDAAIASSGNLTVRAGLNQFQDAFNFYVDTIKKVGGASNVGTKSFTGHSLGGGLAQYMAYATNGAYKTVTFNAVGISQVLGDVNKNDYNDSITNYVNENDFVGAYGGHLGKVITIKDQDSEEARKRNRDTNTAQMYALDAFIEAAGRGEVNKNTAWIASAALTETIQSSVDNALLDPHKPSSLLKSDGNLGEEVPHGNPTVAAINSGIQAKLKVQTVVCDGAYFIFVALPTATVNEAIKVSMEIVDTSVKVFVETSEFIGEKMYEIGTLVGYALYDISTSFGQTMETIGSLINQAGTTPVRLDPIVLDISGLGITTKSITDGVYYDLDNNGFAEKTSWIDTKSGILVLDKSGNGKIETGNELFGDRTILADGTTAHSGFAALAALDTNHDGIIDTKDAAFSDLRIWIDKNGDGVSSPDELTTLQEAGVMSIGLGYSSVNQTDKNGNTIARVGSFTRTDGTTADIKEFFLQRDTKDVKVTQHIEIPEDIMTMPEVHPIGNTYSLRQAMSLDKSGTLKQLIQEFLDDSSTESRQAKLHDILFAWTGVTNIDPASRGPGFDARKLAALETITGTSYQNSPTSQPTSAATPMLERSYNILAESVYTMLMMQVDLRAIMSGFNYTLDLEAAHPIKLDVTSVQEYLEEQLQTNSATGEKMLAEITRVLRNRNFVSETEFANLCDHFAKKSVRYQRIIDTAPLTTMVGTNASDSINGIADRDNVMSAGEGDDYINGSNGNDIIYGESGDDTIYGGAGKNLLVGGVGNDRLYGGTGNDTYIFNRGDGIDTIYEDGGTDVISFGADIKPEDIVAKMTGFDGVASLELSIRDTEDKLIIHKHFGTYGYASEDKPSPNSQIEKIQFSDGTVWGVDELHYRTHVVTGTNEADQLAPANNMSSVEYHGMGGDDILTGKKGDDKLYGDDGNDQIEGGGGNDLLVGGRGNDTISDSSGDDIYIFNLGDGNDTIKDSDGIDELRFGEGISPEDIAVSRFTSHYDAHLKLSIKGTTDSIVIKDYFGSGSVWGFIEKTTYQIEKILFSNDTTWTQDILYYKLHNITGNEGNDTISAYDDNPVVYHGITGDDTLTGGKGDDVLYGDNGNDVLNGQDGNDILIGGRGNDVLSGGKGDDIYLFSRGDGVDIIHDGSGFDIVQFGEGIHPEEVVVKRVPAGNSFNLELSIKDTSDIVKVYRNFYSSTSNRASVISEVHFANGAKWTIDDLFEKMHNITGTEGDDNIRAYDNDNDNVIYHGLSGSDYLSGGGGDDRLYGDAGDDDLFGNNGNDLLVGGHGADKISGGEGNDTLIGGTGDDYLAGGDGDDRYIFARGDGRDILQDSNGNDTIQLGYSHTEVVFQKIYNNLRLEMYNSNDTIYVQSWYDSSNRKIETIQSDNGYTIQPENVQKLIQAMASFGNSHSMSWQQALDTYPTEAQSIISQYWTAPTA